MFDQTCLRIVRFIVQDSEHFMCSYIVIIDLLFELEKSLKGGQNVCTNMEHFVHLNEHLTLLEKC